MKPLAGWDQTQANTGMFERIEAGGYVCSIISAREEKTKNGQDMLVIAFDIDEGKFRGYFKKDFEARKAKTGAYGEVKWRGVYWQLTQDKDGLTNRYFKGLIESIEKSNPGYHWNWDELTLKGKRVGFVFRDEEYERDDGTIALVAKPTWPHTVEAIRQGITAPAVKRLGDANYNGGYSSGYGNGGYGSSQGSSSYGGNGHGSDGRVPPPEDDELPF